MASPTQGHIPKILCITIRSSLLLSIALGSVHAESNSKLTGRVIDPADRAVAGAEVLVRNLATLVERAVTTNNEGIYGIPALPVGAYRMEVSASGFRPYALEAIDTDVARTSVYDVRLEL